MTANRIVSLLPSATEIVCRLGLADQLIGISHECDYPASITNLPRLTRPKIDVNASSRDIDTAVRALSTQGLSVYEVDEAMLAALQPDLIVTQDQCEVCAVDLAEVQRAAAESLGYSCPIVSLQPSSLSDVWDSIEYVAHGAGVPERGVTLRAELDAELAALATTLDNATPRTIACLEWLDPLMYAGHWTLDLVRIASGIPGPDSYTGALEARHEPLLAFDPEVIVLMPCGFDLARTIESATALTSQPWWTQLRAVREGQVWATDGNQYFNRPGPRLTHSAAILAAILQPNRFPDSRWTRKPHAVRLA